MRVSFPGSNEKEIQSYSNDHLPRLTETLRLTEGNTPPGGKVLEVGAKPFVLSAMLLQKGFTYTGIGVSGSEKDLRNDHDHACSTGKVSGHKFSIELQTDEKKWSLPMYEVNIEMDVWPFPEKHFDTIIWTETLEHLTCDPSFAWHEANKRLRKGGKLVFSVPNALYWIRALQLLFGKNIDDPYSWHGPFGRHNRVYTVKEIKQLANLHGFETAYLTTKTFLPSHMSLKKKILHMLISIPALLTGKRKGKTIVAVFEKKEESTMIERPDFLYH